MRLPMQKTDRCVRTGLRGAERDGRRRQLFRSGDHRHVLSRGLKHIGGLAGDAAELAHPIGAEGEQHIGQVGEMPQKSVVVFLDETAVAEQCLDARPFVLGGNARAHGKMGCMTANEVPDRGYLSGTEALRDRKDTRR